MSENTTLLTVATTVVFVGIVVAFACVKTEQVVTRAKAVSDVVKYAKKKK